jgi:hypothetical protein
MLGTEAASLGGKVIILPRSRRNRPATGRFGEYELLGPASASR